MTKKVMTACKGKVLVTELEHGERKTAGGIVLTNDDGKIRGIRSRWARVYSVGEDITDIKEGQWILIDHGRWSRTIEVDGIKLNLVDYPAAVSLVSDEDPRTKMLTFGR
ncbi:hypothetical protein UES1_044 [Escherichia phage UE-S1]|nr:hypothetical protein UES1_044 [Escherichia phage UE-S1]